jgi:hypothetical protein
MLSRSKIRFWDVAAFNLFARIPFNLSLLIFTIPTVRSVMGLAMDGNIARMMEHTNILMVIGVVSLLFSMWYFYWSYKAFAESTNVKNGKGVVAFILSFVVTYLVSGDLLKFI